MFVQQSSEENRFVSVSFHLLHISSQSRFTEVFFLDASDQISLETGFKGIAQAKGVGESFEDGLRYLEGRSDEWLLLLDNADNPKLDLGRYIHRRHGNVLITTRNPHVGDLAPDCHCSVDRLDETDAKDLLLRGVHIPDSANKNTHTTEIVEVCRHYITWMINISSSSPGARLSCPCSQPGSCFPCQGHLRLT
jgi:hypothetical protein